MDESIFRIGDGGEVVPVDLTYDRVLCAQHGEPLRQSWPDGFLALAETLFESLTGTDGFDLIGGNTRLIHESLDRSPICERIDKLTLLRAYQAAGFGIIDTCSLCGDSAMGTSYLTQVSPTTTNRYPHLCFRCVVYGLARAN